MLEIIKGVIWLTWFLCLCGFAILAIVQFVGMFTLRGLPEWVHLLTWSLALIAGIGTLILGSYLAGIIMLAAGWLAFNEWRGTDAFE